MTYFKRTNINQIPAETRREIYQKKLQGFTEKNLKKEYLCSSNVLNEILNEGLEQDKQEVISKRKVVVPEVSERGSRGNYFNILRDITVGDVIVQDG